MARNEKHGRSDRFDQVIGRRLAAERDHCGVLCPDESIIAAYHDRSLGRGESALWERHFAQCARCTSTLAAYARIDDALASGGGSVGRAVADQSRAWWRPRAAIPIAAFGAALAVLFVIAIRTITVGPNPLSGEAQFEFHEEHLPADAATVATNPAPIAKSGQGAALGAGGSPMVMNEAAPLRPAAPNLEESFAAKLSPAPLAAESSARERRRQTSARAEFEDLAERAIKLHKEKTGVATAVPPPVPAAAPSPRASSRAVAASDAAASSVASRPVAAFGAGAPSALATAPASTSVLPPVADGEGVVPASGTEESGSAAGTVTPSNRAAATGAVGVGAALGGAVLSAGASTRGAHGVVLESPDHAGIWTVGERGTISRYTAAAGWVAQVSGVTVDLTSGSAPSAATCWVSGRGGTILRTVDGEHWTKVIAPVREDLVSIVATSATDATISTVSGLRFSTSDGGVNWHPL